MIITDVNGKKLSLSKTTLREVNGECITGNKWTADLDMVRKAVRRSLEGEIDVQLTIHRLSRSLGYKVFGIAYVDAHIQKIGCRRFTKPVWNKIMKAVKTAK